jgi:membrane protease YdiL (CAAX protease family)
METQINSKSATHSHRLTGLGEIAIVFLPVLLFAKLTADWVGGDPVRNMTVIWIANIVMLAMVWLLMKLRKKSWSALGVTFGKITLKESLKVFGLSMVVFVFGIAAYLAGPIVLASFNDAPASADFTRYEYLRDNPMALIISLIGVYIISSFGEEVIFRAFLIDRISEITQGLKGSVAIAVVASSVLFGLFHYEWGIMGMVQTGSMGLAMGISYVVLKRKFWALVLAHAYMDTILLVQLYLVSNAA